MEPSINEPDRNEKPARHTLRLPRFLIGEPVGLGDIVKRITKVVGVTPCAACEQRAARLNSWVRFAQPERRVDS